MKWAPWIVGSLCVVTLAACNGNRRDNNTGAASGTETGTMQGDTGGTATDTAFPSNTGATSGATGGESADTARGTGTADAGNQKQPVTAKGDTLRKPNDSTAVGQQ
jgi:hypothetical protein